MNDTSIKPISKVRSSETNVVRENGFFDSHKTAKRIGNETDNIKNMTNISIHFDVDEDTKRLVVIVTDRDSGRILRTIPANELDKMQAGDLLKLKA